MRNPFYKILSKQLEDWGFVANNYDRCTLNKMVNYKQLTVQFHVDSLKCSHVKQPICVLDKLIDDLNDKFKTEKKKLLETEGLIHICIGLTISYEKKHQVMFTMYDYLEDILDKAPTDMGGINTPPPAKADLFTLDHKSLLLYRKQLTNSIG